MSKIIEKYLAISGGIGGAKLALGLNHALDPSQLTVIANTGDDFIYHDLNISPDIDTLLYTFADLNNTELGWGRCDETWNFAEACEQLGMDTWFRLGDKDLAIHLYRSERLRQGVSLSEVIRELCVKFKIYTEIVPMSDSPVATFVESDIGTLSFQEYFVKNRCKPKVSKIYFKGAKEAEPAPAFLQALNDEELRGIIICPSNPFLSVNPILSIPGIKEKIKKSGKPVLVVSPVVNGQSLKGPTEKLMNELNLRCNVISIAEIYQDIATTIIIDSSDKFAIKEIESLGLSVLSTNIIMNELTEKIDLANRLIELTRNL
jgi:LPPG:FO 2-phospho-L-lactate transferase